MLKGLFKLSLGSSLVGYLFYSSLLYSTSRSGYLYFLADDQTKVNFYGVAHSISNSGRAAYARNFLINKANYAPS